MKTFLPKARVYIIDAYGRWKIAFKEWEFSAAPIILLGMIYAATICWLIIRTSKLLQCSHYLFDRATLFVKPNTEVLDSFVSKPKYIIYDASIMQWSSPMGNLNGCERILAGIRRCAVALSSSAIDVS